MIELWDVENAAYDEGFEYVCGIDEAGRGPLAGPVCAAAVILPRGLLIEGLNDSKKLTQMRRESLFDVICERAVSFGIAFASVEEIEEMNILNAAFSAMRRAASQLTPPPSLALVDGNREPGLEIPTRTIIKGDARCACIAAASVLAKVTRDRYMLEAAELYPRYGFERHKGYGTAAHYAALRELGPSPIHRPSFLRKMH